MTDIYVSFDNKEAKQAQIRRKTLKGWLSCCYVYCICIQSVGLLVVRKSTLSVIPSIRVKFNSFPVPKISCLNHRLVRRYYRHQPTGPACCLPVMSEITISQFIRKHRINLIKYQTTTRWSCSVCGYDVSWVKKGQIVFLSQLILALITCSGIFIFLHSNCMRIP